MSYIDYLEDREIKDYIKVVETNDLAYALKNTSKKVPGFSGKNNHIPRQMVIKPIVSLAKAQGRDGIKIRGILNEIVGNRNKEALKLLDIEVNIINDSIESNNREKIVELTFDFAQKTSLRFSSYVCSTGKKDKVDFDLIKEIESQLIQFYVNREDEEEQIEKKAIEKCQSDYEIKEQSYKNKITKVSNHIIKLKTELHEKVQEIQEKKNKNDIVSAELERLQNENEELKRISGELKRDLTDTNEEFNDLKNRVQSLRFNELITTEDIKAILCEKKEDSGIIASRFFEYISDTDEQEPDDQKLDHLWQQWIVHERKLISEYLSKLRVKNVTIEEIDKLKEIEYLAEMRACIIQILQAMGYKVLENNLLEKLY